MSFYSITDIDLNGKRVFIRSDLNVPMDGATITSDIRIQASMETIKYAAEKNAAVMVVSHLGRPKAGVYDEKQSLAPVAKRMSELLGKEVRLVKNWLDGVKVAPGEVVLCENVRFLVGEAENNEELSKKMASLCDVYVNDAFATAHRKEGSTYGIAKYAPVSCAGMLMTKELNALNSIMKHPERPLVAIIGGSKVSTKLALLKSIVKVVDYLIVGGGIANTFLAAAGKNIGTSLYEADLVDEANSLMVMAKSLGVHIPLPTDVVVSDKLAEDSVPRVESVLTVGDNDKIFDIGPDTEKMFADIIKTAKTVLWNGPVGAFEFEQFSKGTEGICNAVAHSKAFSVVGGGDTIAAIEKYELLNSMSYVSTAGGAFLAYLEDENLPAVAALKESCSKKSK